MHKIYFIPLRRYPSPLVFSQKCKEPAFKVSFLNEVDRTMPEFLDQFIDTTFCYPFHCCYLHNDPNFHLYGTYAHECDPLDYHPSQCTLSGCHLSLTGGSPSG